MRELKLWEKYDRQDAHDIFAPHTAFTPQSGTWGLQGIVAIPERPNSVVFFVTLGKQQGDHIFEESVTEDGVLTWQSQPQQDLDTPRIKQLIRHDEVRDAVYLFLRNRPGIRYVYCGTLGYLNHDRDRQKPVHFTWQLMDWPPPPEVLPLLDVQTTPGVAFEVAEPQGLVEGPLPATRARGGVRTGTFQGSKQPTYPDNSAQNAALGLAGEHLVLAHERRRLIGEGRPDLADMVVHVSVVEGDAAGYDIRSFEADGSLRFIEVKTTRGAASTAFFASPNEIARSEEHGERYVLMRLYAFNSKINSARFYQVRGKLKAAFVLTPTEYRLTLAPTASLDLS